MLNRHTSSTKLIWNIYLYVSYRYAVAIQIREEQRKVFVMRTMVSIRDKGDERRKGVEWNSATSHSNFSSREWERGESVQLISEAWNFVEGAKRIFPLLRRTKRGFRFAIRQLSGGKRRSERDQTGFPSGCASITWCFKDYFANYSQEGCKVTKQEMILMQCNGLVNSCGTGCRERQSNPNSGTSPYSSVEGCPLK